MPLQRQKSLRAAPRLEPTGCALDELLGPAGARPGELYEPLVVGTTADLRRAAQAAGVPPALALAVVIERSLIATELGAAAVATVAWLDQRATVQRELPLAKANADYARTLMAALNGRLPPIAPDDAPPVVPTRLADRVRASRVMDLPSSALLPSLVWELASVRSGRTMTEWALGELVAERYPLSAARQEEPAASAAR